MEVARFVKWSETYMKNGVLHKTHVNVNVVTIFGMMNVWQIWIKFGM